MPLADHPNGTRAVKDRGRGFSPPSCCCCGSIEKGAQNLPVNWESGKFILPAVPKLSRRSERASKYPNKPSISLSCWGGCTRLKILTHSFVDHIRQSWRSAKLHDFLFLIHAVRFRFPGCHAS